MWATCGSSPPTFRIRASSRNRRTCFLFRHRKIIPCIKIGFGRSNVDFWLRVGEFEQFLDRWRKRPPQIRDLSDEEAAAYAMRIFQRLGRTKNSARFIYHALALNSKQPQALMCLSDYFRTGAR